MRKGIILTIIAAIVSGWAVFINKFALVNWSSSEIYTTEKNIIAALFLTVVFAGWLYRREIRALSKNDWVKLATVGIIGGALPFILFFKGLSIADSSSIAFFHKTLFIWVAILAIPILKEKLSKVQLFAFVILVVGNFSLFYPKELSFGVAGLLILVATIIWALESVLAKKFMSTISAPIMAWGRMFFGSILLLAYIIVSGKVAVLAQISPIQIPWLLIVGITLFLYVTFWYGGLKRLPATVAAAILTIASPITTLLNNIYSGNALPAGFWYLFISIIIAATILSTTSLTRHFDAKELKS